MRGEGRRPLTCYHEAGHAVAVWWAGHVSDRAVVLTTAEVRRGVTIAGRRGKAIEGEGAVVGYDIAEVSSIKRARRMADVGDSELWHECEAHVRMSMVVSYAGPIAEARYRRAAIGRCFYDGGMMDIAEADRVAAEWFGDGPDVIAAHERAERVARDLVRSPMGWAAVRSVAAILHAWGEIGGAEIAALCVEVYGATPYPDGWAKRWPPTAGEIRSGHLPQQREMARAA